MKKIKGNIIGHGESTHTHVANGKDVTVLGDEAERNMELDAPNGCLVTHEEHKTIEIPAGRYEVGGVLEFDPATEESREVRD